MPRYGMPEERRYVVQLETGEYIYAYREGGGQLVLEKVALEENHSFFDDEEYAWAISALARSMGYNASVVSV